MNRADGGRPSTRALVRRVFSEIAEPQPLSDAALRRVQARLPVARPRPALLSVLRIATVGALLGIAGGAFAHFTIQRIRGDVDAPLRTTETRTVKKIASPRAVRVAVPRPAPEAMVAESARAAPRAVEARGPSPASAPPKTSALALEAASLADALSLLRSKGQPKTALLAVEAHLHAYPNGPLRLEAELARLDALLALGQRAEARRSLERLPLAQLGRQVELRLIRAELRADDDCRAALSDFAALPELGLLPTAFAERALFGRAACRLRVGERRQAAEDFAEYLRMFPNGRFAAQARAPR